MLEDPLGKTKKAVGPLVPEPCVLLCLNITDQQLCFTAISLCYTF